MDRLSLPVVSESAEFKDEERSGWFIGIGRAMMTRGSLFRETKGVAVEMVNRVFDLPPFSGNFYAETAFRKWICSILLKC